MLSSALDSPSAPSSSRSASSTSVPAPGPSRDEKPSAAGRPTPSSVVRRLVGILPLLALVLVACGDDATGPTPNGGTEREPVELGVVLNSVDRSLTLFPADGVGGTSTVGLGADGSPVGFSSRGNVVAVPMGTVPAVAVVDGRAGRRVRTVALPDNSGATGSAFVNDSMVAVSNPNLNSVTPVNVLRGTTGTSVDVGTFPQAVAVADGRVVVANAELGPDFSPSGPGTVTVLGAGDWEVQGTVTLSGLNPAAVTVGPDGRVWVLNSGTFGGGNGSVSVVEPAALEEVGHHDGFGEFPGSLAFGGDGLLHVTSLSYGIAVWNPATGDFVRSPAEAVAPEGTTSVSDLAFDGGGRLHAAVTLLPDQAQACFGPGVVYRLNSDFGVDREVEVGTCPFALEFIRFED